MDPTLDGSVPPSARSWLLGSLVTVWLAGAIGGLVVVWSYDNAPGIAAKAPNNWPAATRLARAAGDNAGRASIVALLNRAGAATASTNVFGCSFLASAKS